jgi:hypothetical protein
VHELDDLATVRLDYVMNVDAWHPESHEHLGDELVARERGEIRRRVEPVAEFISSGAVIR